MIVFPMAPVFTPIREDVFCDCGSMLRRVLDSDDFGGTFFNDVRPVGLFEHPEVSRSRKASTLECPASEISLTPDNFALTMDVRGFMPEEISVKTVGNSVEVHARHEEETDQRGLVLREFRRKYTLPDDVDPESVTSKLTGRGLLAVEAPRKTAEKIALSETVPIPVEHRKSSELDVPTTSQGSS
ncbi:unnamed protein product [Ixodes hexagonus]